MDNKLPTDYWGWSGGVSVCGHAPWRWKKKPSYRNPFKTFSYRAFIVSHKFTLMYFQCFYNNLLQFALKEECHSPSFNYFTNYEVTPGAHHLVTLVQFLYIIRISDRYSRHKSAQLKEPAYLNGLYMSSLASMMECAMVC